MNEKRCKAGCEYTPLTEQLCYFHQKVEAGLIDGYVDTESRVWVPLQRAPKSPRRCPRGLPDNRPQPVPNVISHLRRS